MFEWDQKGHTCLSSYVVIRVSAEGQKVMGSDRIGEWKRERLSRAGLMEALCNILRLLSPCTAICLCHPAHSNPARRARFHPPIYYCTSLCSYIRQLAGGFTLCYSVPPSLLCFPHTFHDTVLPFPSKSSHVSSCPFLPSTSSSVSSPCPLVFPSLISSSVCVTAPWLFLLSPLLFLPPGPAGVAEAA